MTIQQLQYILEVQRTGTEAKCGYTFDQTCAGDTSRGKECAAQLALADNLTLIDLRAGVLVGKDAAATTVAPRVQTVRMLTDYLK